VRARFRIAFVAVTVLVAARAEADDATARNLLAKAIRSSNVKEQVELIGKLAETESEIAPTVLNAWREGKVFVHETPDGQKFLPKDEWESDADRGWKSNRGS
jgi:hypothetical protein